MISLELLRSCGVPLVTKEAAVLQPKRCSDIPGDQSTLPEPLKQHGHPKPQLAQQLERSEITAVQSRVEEEARRLGLEAKLLAVEAEPPYYEQSLEWRRDRLGASSVEELCKSVVLENTKEAGAESGRVRCVLVIVQYVGKLHKEKLIKVVQALEASRGLPPLGKKQYNMRLLEGTACQEMTGFGHNAVTPLGLDLPMILSDAIAQLPSGKFWLGGGHVDLKLRLNVGEAVEALRLTVADVTYKKNYKLEKAEAVLLRCTRHAEERSGAWLVKYLNHISQVRMKQSRDVEAMEMMYEIESLANFPMHEPGASEFYETLFRNMSSSLRRMGREDDAAVYFIKMAEATHYHKKQLDWMDLWDLGILIANRAYQAGRWPEFYKSREIIAEAAGQVHAKMAEGGDAPQHIQLKVKDQQGSEVQFKPLGAARCWDAELDVKGRDGRELKPIQKDMSSSDRSDESEVDSDGFRATVAKTAKSFVGGHTVVKWVIPFVLVGISSVVCMWLLHIATFYYVKGIIRFEAAFKPDPTYKEDAVTAKLFSPGLSEKDVSFGSLQDPIEAQLGFQDVPIKALDLIAAVFPMIWGVTVIYLQDVQAWTKVLLCHSVLAFGKGVFGATTIIPDSIGWANCKKRLGPEGLQYFESEVPEPAKHGLWATLMAILGIELMGPHQDRIGAGMRFCADMLYSGHTYFTILYILGLCELLRLASPKFIKNPTKRSIFLGIVYTLCIAQQCLEITLVLRNRFHYTTDVVMAVLLTFLWYTSAPICIAAKWWAQLGNADPQPAEGQRESFVLIPRSALSGDVWLPSFCVPFCCINGKHHVISEHQLKLWEEETGADDP
ncbi:unnamed protein product [Effrenium voratum]|uniref:Sphingomyelin synthase-like domain-containing protein n=1 Tax=Effrenium voratum TaxID=2562239 RepID=A0AA36HT85_9DINO|nr:unnamed protein product [Effrenium voratum]